MTTLKAVIVASDKATIQLVSKSLSTHFPGIQLLATTDNIADGEKLILQHQPNLVIVEIALDNDAGMKMLDHLTPYSFEVLFICKTRDCHCHAINYQAIGMLVLPIDNMVLNTVIIRAIEKIQHQMNKLTENIENDLNIQHSLNMNLSVFDNGKYKLIRMGDIAYLHSDTGCTTIFMNNKSKETSSSQIGDIEPHLPLNIYIRIHRSYIANIKSVKSSSTRDKTLFIQMNNGDEIPVSRHHKKALLTMLKKNIA